jgi:hypothetical protein
MHTTALIELGKKQVQDFCHHIEMWFNGTATDQQALYEAITNTFDPAFQLINGDGNTVDFPMLTQWLHQVYGQFPQRKVEVKNIEAQATSHHVLVSYTEIQYTDDSQNTRQASAVFRYENGKTLWYHLVEEWV